MAADKNCGSIVRETPTAAESHEGEDQQLADLEYTGDDINELGVTLAEDGDTVTYTKSLEYHMDRYVWLICWFLQAVVSAEIWKHEVNGSIRYQEKRKNIAQWMTSSDLAYLCTIYIHSYKKWKKEAEMKFATPGGETHSAGPQGT